MVNNLVPYPIHTNVPIKYFVDFPRVEPIEVNSGRLMDYKVCPELYRLKHVLGYRVPKPEIYLTWGGTVHKFFEALEVIKSKNPEYPLEAVVGLATIEAMQYWGNTRDPDPTDRKFGFMTKARLADLLLYASKNWLQEKASGRLEVVASEKSFSVQLANGMYISGTPDQIVRWTGNKHGRDYKITTQDIKWFKRQLFPNEQFIRYNYGESELIGEKIHGQIIDIYFMTKDKGPTFHRELVSFSQQTIDRWLFDQDYYQHVLTYSRENDNYPQNEKACKYCPFHKVCANQSQAGKDYTLKSEFKFEPFDNMRKGSIFLGD